MAVQAPAEPGRDEALERRRVLRRVDPHPEVRAARTASPRSGRGCGARSSPRSGSRRTSRGSRSGSAAAARRKSSLPRISNHRSSTGCTFVKNRCPPMSKRQPSRSAVRLMPPTTVSDSRIVDGTPRLVSTYAAVSPAGPAPMMTISWSVSGGTA